jgi:predicted ATPase
MPKNKAKSPITGFRISNFKAFAGTQYIPIRPITLIYGANSSGKSSVLHSLLLAHHAITNKGELDVYRTEAGGDSVDLGGFGQYVHKRQRSNVIEWTVDLDPQHLNLQNIEPNFIVHLESLLKDVNKLTVRILIGISPAEKGRVRVLSFFIEADDNSILRMSHIPGGNSLKLNDIGDTSNINQLIDRVLGGMESTSTPRPPSRQELQQAIDELVPKITREVYRLIPTEREIRDDEFISSSKTRKSELTTEDLASLFVGHFTSLIEIIHDAVEDEIGRLQYLGPFRTYPPRHFAFSRQKDANWEAGGGYAWDILLNNTGVRNKVNAWLGDRDRMKTPYELKVRHLFSDTEVKKTIDSGITNKLLNLTTQLMFYASGIGEPEIKEKIEQLKASLQVIGTDVEDFEQILAKLQENNFFEEIKKLTSLENNPQGHPLNGILIEIEAILSSLTDTDSLSDDWVREMTIGGDQISDLVLIDKRTDTMVSHRDVGIGISQVIPILVSCYGLSDALIAIEQPEIHLHPKLQAELGDVFIESALGEQKNTFILETHSEHLLLRIMRRMRETYNNELPEGCLPVRPEDVSILFVEADGEGSIVREMPLNKRGELVKAWPGGFFEEELDEIF